MLQVSLPALCFQTIFPIRCRISSPCLQILTMMLTGDGVEVPPRLLDTLLDHLLPPKKDERPAAHKYATHFHNLELLKSSRLWMLSNAGLVV